MWQHVYQNKLWVKCIIDFITEPQKSFLVVILLQLCQQFCPTAAQNIFKYKRDRDTYRTLGFSRTPNTRSKTEKDFLFCAASSKHSARSKVTVFMLPSLVKGKKSTCRFSTFTHQHRPVHPGPPPSRPYTRSGTIPPCWRSGRSYTCPESHTHQCL